MQGLILEYTSWSRCWSMGVNCWCKCETPFWLLKIPVNLAISPAGGWYVTSNTISGLSAQSCTSCRDVSLLSTLDCTLTLWRSWILCSVDILYLECRLRFGVQSLLRFVSTRSTNFLDADSSNVILTSCRLRPITRQSASSLRLRNDEVWPNTAQHAVEIFPLRENSVSTVVCFQWTRFI